MKQLSDYTLISDIDGTLLPSDGIIPQRNIEAIRRFAAQGGKFGVATGRSLRFTVEQIKHLPINIPCIICNGSAIYDMQADQILMELPLPDTAKAYTREILEEMPHIGVVMMRNDGDETMQSEEDFIKQVITWETLPLHQSKIDVITGSFYKLIFYVQPKDKEAFLAYLNKKNYPDVRFVASHHTLIEMLPCQSRKGFALEKMIDMGMTTRENLVAVGDYYNDLEMILLAGTGATLCDAPDDLKGIADLVVGTCEQGAIADVVEYLERLCGQT